MNTQVARRPSAEAKNVLQSVVAEIDRRAPELVAILPRDVSLEEFKRVTVGAIQDNPELLECTFKSLFGSITRIAREGWVPDGRECYLDVRKNTKTGEKTCIVIPGIHGYLKNTIGISLDDWRGGVVREGDDYEVELGDNEHFVLRVDPFKRDSERPIIGAYSIAWLPGAKRPSRQFMGMKELMLAKSKSSSAHSPYSPWNTFPEDMFIKTVMKKHANRLPVGKKAAELLAEEREQDKGELVEQRAPGRPRATPTQQLEHAANGHAREEDERRPQRHIEQPSHDNPPAHREESPSQNRSSSPSGSTAQSASPDTGQRATSPEKREDRSPASSASTTEQPERRAVGRPKGSTAKPPQQQTRQHVQRPPENERQRDIEDDAERDGRSEAHEELDPVENARLRGESAYENGDERTPPAEYMDGRHMDELDGWYQGWDDMDEGSRGAARAMS